MTIVFRIVILALLPAMAYLGHGDHLVRRFKGQAAPAGAGGRTGHASVYVWFFCYVAVFVLAAGRMLLGSAPGVLAAIGILVMAAGVGLRRLALPVIGDLFDEFILIRKDHRVVDTGVYRMMRHPLLKGLMLEIAGMTLVSAHFSAFVFFAVALAFFFIRSIQEEKALLSALGEPYRAYLESVPSVVDLLPRSWRTYAPERKKAETDRETEESSDGETKPER